MKSTATEFKRLSRKTDKRKPRSTAFNLALLLVVILLSVVVYEVAITFFKGALR